MKKQDKKALELKLARIRTLTQQNLGEVVGGIHTIPNEACTTGTGCGCTVTGPN